MKKTTTTYKMVADAFAAAEALLAKLPAVDAERFRRDRALSGGMINRYAAVRDLPQKRAIIKSTEIGGFIVLNEEEFSAVARGELSYREAVETCFIRNGAGDCVSIIACSPMRRDESCYR